MNINEISKITNLSAKSIRFYEEKGLITKAKRNSNGYRIFEKKHIEELNLIYQSKLIGFSLDQIKNLMALYKTPKLKNIDVKNQTLKKIKEIELRIAELNKMKNKLMDLANSCPGDENDNCPILKYLTEKEYN